MAEAIVTILGMQVRVPCADGEQAWIEALAAQIERRAASGEGAAAERLARIALALLAENQTAGAALARARGEIERLNDLAAETPELAHGV